MTTVPAFLADLAVSLELCSAEQLRPHGRRIGESIEVDLESLSAAGETATADWLAATWALWRERAGSERALQGRRTLVEAVQLDTKKTRRDLREECEALVALPGYGPLLDELLGAEPDRDRLAEEIARLGGAVRLEEQTAIVELCIPHLPVWPEALGGAASPAETSRELVAVIRWAKWRDRRSRRLAALHVVALEAWPEPAPRPA
jgi:hypothetical protein